MSTTGVADWTPDVAEAIEEAYERCGVEARTGYQFRTARRSLNLLFAEWANMGINLWTVESGTVALVAGTATYALPADTVDLMEHVLRTNAGNTSTQTDIATARISTSTYATIPNKLVQGRPLQIVVNRTNTPSVTVWPVPDSAQTYTLAYWRLRRVQNAGDGANTLDMPFRYYPAMVAGLAWHLSLKVPEALPRRPILEAAYKEAWETAASEDREKAPVRFVPMVGRI